MFNLQSNNLNWTRIRVFFGTTDREEDGEGGKHISNFHLYSRTAKNYIFIPTTLYYHHYMTQNGWWLNDHRKEQKSTFGVNDGLIE